jgi:alkylhydroperoxidase family enzyme
LARVPLINPAPESELGPLAAKLSGARRGKLINVYRGLLNSPTLAESWFQHINAVRWGTSLDGRLREIVIIRIGYLANAAYVIKQHVPKLAVADGVSIEECEALRDWQASPLFDARERAVLAYADAVTRDAAASDETFAAVARHFDAKGLVDLTVLIATYNMHARVVNALALDLEAD